MADLLQKYAAPMHTVEVAWRLKTTRQIVIGPDPRLVLCLRAYLRDLELRTLRIDYPELGTLDLHADAVLAEMPHIGGARRLKAEGENWADGCEDIDALGIPKGPVSEVRYYGSTIAALVHNRCAHPSNYWAMAGRIAVPKGLCVGLIVTASKPTVCTARFAGT